MNDFIGDQQNRDENISQAVDFLKKQIQELERKLNFWQVDPQIWSNDAQGMKTALKYIERYFQLETDLNQSFPASTDNITENVKDNNDKATDCDEEESFISNPTSNRSRRICQCNHEQNEEDEEENEAKLLENRMLIRDLRLKIISLNKKHESSIMELVEKDSTIVELEEYISDLNQELCSNKDECQAHISVIQELTSTVNSQESLSRRKLRTFSSEAS